MSVAKQQLQYEPEDAIEDLREEIRTSVRQSVENAAMGSVSLDDIRDVLFHLGLEITGKLHGKEGTVRYLQCLAEEIDRAGLDD